MDQGIQELEAAARILLAAPQNVTHAQRQAAEQIFMDFRKMKAPFNICRHILDHCHVDLVLFEAATLLKDALIREWKSLSTETRQNLRTYLLQFVVDRPQLSAFVRERILQVVAIMVKRGSVEDLGLDRAHILTEVQQLIMGGDNSFQMVGCSVIAAIMQEYASTVKSSDIGLRWEVHYKAKKQFEMTDLRRIFQFVLEALGSLLNHLQDPLSRESCLILSRLLAIAETILSWSFAPLTNLPKRLIGVFESDQNPSLRPGPQWRETLLNPAVVQLFFKMHFKVRHLPDLCHHTLNCLIQLASLNGTVVQNRETRFSYVNNYIAQLLDFLSNTELSEQETLGVSSLFRKLVLFFPADILALLPADTLQHFVAHFSRLTCWSAEQAMRQDATGDDDQMFMEAFDNFLVAWDCLAPEPNIVPQELRRQVFDTYLRCKLSPPEGIRGRENGDEEGEVEIEETEEDDRTRFKDQLSTIGSFGRFVPQHSLPTLAKLLESRTSQFSSQLQKIHSQSLSIADHHHLSTLFEDLHWLLLIAGNVLALDSDGETALIPQELVKHSLQQSPSIRLDLSLQILASPGNPPPENIDDVIDHLLRVVAAVLRLCEVERHAADAGMGLMLSPELGTSMVWCLQRFAATYLMPNESNYNEISPAICAAFGQDSEGASWLVGFLLNKIESNLRTQNAEQTLVMETLHLFVTLLDTREKQTAVVSSGAFWSLVRLQSSNELSQLCGAARQKFFQALTVAGAGALNTEHAKLLGDPNYFWNQVLHPIQERLMGVVRADIFNRAAHQEETRAYLTQFLEALIGIVRGSQLATVGVLFPQLKLLFPDIIRILDVCYNYPVVVELVLEFFTILARQMLIFLPQSDSQCVYDFSLQAVRTYAQHASGRITPESTAEEEAFRDLILLMELLMNLLSKDIIDLSPVESMPTSNNPVSAAEVCLHGLNLILPLMNAELLRFPLLCNHYFKLITFACEICPEKIISLPPKMLSDLFGSVQLGLTSFGPDVATLSFDFLQVLATTIVKNRLQGSVIHEAMKPFLKMVLDMILSQQINSDVLNTSSGALYALICAYQNEYQSLVESLLTSQDDVECAKRLVGAFNSLTRDVGLTADRNNRLKFRDNFDAFIMEVRSVLVVK